MKTIRTASQGIYTLVFLFLAACQGGKSLTPMEQTFGPPPLLGGSPTPTPQALPVSVSIIANGVQGLARVAVGGNVVISWNSVNATICHVTHNDNSLNLSNLNSNLIGSIGFSNVRERSMFRATCTNVNTGEQEFAEVTVEVDSVLAINPLPPNVPAVGISLSNANVSNQILITGHPYNTPVSLSWGASQVPVSCLVAMSSAAAPTPQILSTAVQGTNLPTGNLIYNTTFTVMCFFAGNIVSAASADVVVAPPATPPVIVTRFVFATSQRYSGNLGGLSGADAKCNALADASLVPGVAEKTYKALLSIPGTNARDRITLAPTDKIHNLNPTTANREVATGQTFFSGTLARAIQFDENGDATAGIGGDAPGYEDIWSSSTNTGLFKSYAGNSNDEACRGWTSGSSNIRVVVGNSRHTSQHFDYRTSGSGSSMYSDCGESRYFYCISQ